MKCVGVGAAKFPKNTHVRWGVCGAKKLLCTECAGVPKLAAHKYSATNYRLYPLYLMCEQTAAAATIFRGLTRVQGRVIDVRRSIDGVTLLWRFLFWFGRNDNCLISSGVGPLMEYFIINGP